MPAREFKVFSEGRDRGVTRRTLARVPQAYWRRMDPLREIDALVEHEGRWPGTDAERRAARHLEERLAEMGRDVELEPTSVWPNYPVTHVIHALLAIAGSVLSVGAPLPGMLLVFLAA